jgi:hypothetical protein
LTAFLLAAYEVKEREAIVALTTDGTARKRRSFFFAVSSAEVATRPWVMRW